MTLGRTLGAIGRALISAGVLILLFVAYQLWGTGLAEARAQNDLEDEFAELLEGGGLLDGPSTTVTTLGPGTGDDRPTTTTSSTLPPAPAPPEGGEPVARLVIPRIGVDKIVVEGVSVADLKRAPGHYPGTSLPGFPGNSAIAGHRTTYGAPFYRLDELAPGDEIVATTVYGEFHYEVVETMIVAPNQVDVLDKALGDRLTLTTCHPRFSARQRMVVVADLVGRPTDAPPPRPSSLPVEDAEGPGDDDPTVSLPVEDDPPAGDTAGLSGEGASNTPAILWGLAAAFVWFTAWLLARGRRPMLKWATYAVFLPGFLVVLFVFFENFSRLLPANY
jgi:sortase A